MIVIELLEFELEEFSLIDRGTYKTLRLEELTEEERYLVDPIVAPTSGLRIKILDKPVAGSEKVILTKRKLFLFLRVFKAISQKYKEMKDGNNLKVLIVTDDRPTRSILLEYCSQIFAYDGYEIFHQEGIPGESKASAPYGAASVGLIDDINLLTSLDDNDFDGVALTNNKGLAYKLVFEEDMEVSLIGDDDADTLYLNILGTEYEIDAMDSNSITVVTSKNSF